MSHEFESGFFARESAWHGLGVNVDQNLSWEDALRTAGLDWEVGLRPLFAQLGADIFEEAPGHVGIVRSSDDRVLGVAGSRYTPIQNREAFSIFDRLFGNDAVLNTAGALKGGAVVFGLAELPPATIATEAHRRFLLVSTSHDGSGALRALPTAVRVVCWNTLSMALRDRAGIAIKHTAKAAQRLDAKTNELAVALGMFDRYAQAADRLLGCKVSDSDQVDLCRGFDLCKAWKDEKRAEFLEKSPAGTILRLAYSGAGNRAIGGTAWGLLQGVTEYVDHHRTTRGDQEARFAYQTLGVGSQHKAQAFHVLDEFAVRRMAA